MSKTSSLMRNLFVEKLSMDKKIQFEWETPIAEKIRLGDKTRQLKKGDFDNKNQLAKLSNQQSRSTHTMKNSVVEVEKFHYETQLSRFIE